MSGWLLLITNLPGGNNTLRMRVWRGLKLGGAVALRDGVYLLPDGPGNRDVLEKHAGGIRDGRGTAHVVSFNAPAEEDRSFRLLFDRTRSYVPVLKRLTTFRLKLEKLTELAARREIERIARELAAIGKEDFFPGAAKAQTETALANVRAALEARFSQGEPRAAKGRILQRDPTKYRARTWVTREHLWVDRVASAWVIRRFIDRKARFLWLKDVSRRSRASVGFDFDGAEFTHVGHKVTFEVLLESFGLDDDAGLRRLASLVHYLDVGGIPVPEAAGLVALMSGARALQQGDDALLRAMTPALDYFHAAFLAEEPKIQSR